MTSEYNSTGRARFLGAPATAAAVFIASVAPAFAHGGEDITEKTALSTWTFTPDIVIPTILVVAIYITGMIRRRGVTTPVPWWRHALFFTGVASVFLALQSPIDPIAERLFWVHQIQHYLLRMLGPMLIALSWPEGLLISGMPAQARRSLLAPVISNSTLRRTFSLLNQPIIVTLLFIAALYVWEIPRYHDIALLNDPIHYLMHMTMLFAGLLFWWRVFDRRPPKSATDMDDENERWWHFFNPRPSQRGLGYGIRLMMLVLVMLSNIVLGAYTTLKSDVLYTAYDVLGRLWGFSALKDEQIGGVIIWIPSSMMCVIAILIIVHMWALNETRQDEKRISLIESGSNSVAWLYPTTGAALVERARPRNRLMALGFSVFVGVMFAMAIMIGVMSHGVHRHPPQIDAHSSLPSHA